MFNVECVEIYLCFFRLRITLLAFNGYETGLSTGKNLILMFYVKELGGNCQHYRKKITNTASPAKNNKQDEETSTLQFNFSPIINLIH